MHAGCLPNREHSSEQGRGLSSHRKPAAFRSNWLFYCDVAHTQIHLTALLLEEQNCQPHFCAPPSRCEAVRTQESTSKHQNQHPHPSPPSLPHLCRSHLPNTATENFYKGFSDLALGSELSSAKQEGLSDSSLPAPPQQLRDAALTEEAIRAGSLLLEPVKYLPSIIY